MCPMEYIVGMQTVVETPSYLKTAEVVFSTEEREGIVAMETNEWLPSKTKLKRQGDSARR
jgi:hypothetical protein